MIYLIALGVIILDQLTKIIILNEMVVPKIIKVMPCFNLILAYNTGVSFSMFAGNNPYVLSIIALSVCALLAWWMQKETDEWTRIGFVMIIGGAVSNVIDRFIHGAVVDFLDFYIGSYHWPAFNVADMAICIGAGIVILRSFLTNKGKQK
ncbi:MAG: signal peptidase II [Alphaproteobacteria bacterium]|nr:signal peptidase II [Alphaproteobacteria bacterium]